MFQKKKKKTWDLAPPPLVMSHGLPAVGQPVSVDLSLSAMHANMRTRFEHVWISEEKYQHVVVLTVNPSRIQPVSRKDLHIFGNANAKGAVTETLKSKAVRTAAYISYQGTNQAQIPRDRDVFSALLLWPPRSPPPPPHTLSLPLCLPPFFFLSLPFLRSPSLPSLHPFSLFLVPPHRTCTSSSRFLTFSTMGAARCPMAPSFFTNCSWLSSRSSVHWSGGTCRSLAPSPSTSSAFAPTTLRSPWKAGAGGGG